MHTPQCRAAASVVAAICAALLAQPARSGHTEAAGAAISALQEAGELLAAGRQSEAADSFRRAIELGDATLVMSALSQAAAGYFRMQEYDLLIGLCHRALDQHAEEEQVRAAAHYHAGRAHQAKGERDEAIAQFEALVKECPTSLWRHQAAQLLSDIYTGTGNYAAAEAVIREELRLSPGNVGLGLRLVDLLERRGEAAAAVNLCERLLKDQPDAEAIAHRLYRLSKDNGTLEAYIEGLQAALEQRPEDTALRRRLADVYMGERRYAEAIAENGKLLAAEPADATLHQRIAWLLEQSGDLEQAKNHYEAALALQPDNPALYAPLGDVYMRLGDDEAAISAWKKSTRYDESDPHSMGRLGQMLYERGRYDLALQTYTAARAAMGDKTAYAEQVARTYEALLDFDAAIAEYLRAAVASAAPTNPIPPTASLAVELAEAEGKLPELIQQAEALLQEHPGSSALVAVLTRAYTKAGDARKATDLVTRLGDSEAAPPGFLLALADTMLAQGDADAAAELFRKVRSSPGDPVYQGEADFGLGRALSEQRQWPAAAEAFERALAGDSRLADDPNLAFDLAEIYLRHLGNVNRAHELYEGIHAYDTSTRHRVEMGLADCLFALGEYDDASRRYTHISAAAGHMIPEAPPPPPFGPAIPVPLMPWPVPFSEASARPRYMIAECAFRSGDFERASDLFGELAADAPSSPEANDALRRVQLIRGDMALDPEGAEQYVAALGQHDMGEHDTAHQTLARLANAEPPGPLADDALMLLASMLADEGAVSEARGIYQRLVFRHANSPLRPAAILALGELCEDELDDKSSAVQQYQRLVREYPRSSMAAQARIRLEELGAP